MELKRNIAVILITALTLLVFTLIVCLMLELDILESLGGRGVTYSFMVKSFVYAVISTIVLIVLVLFAFVSKAKYWMLFIILLFICICIMELINLTGGLTDSPCTALYGASMTAVLLIYKRPTSLIIACIIILSFFVCSLWHQKIGAFNPIDTSSMKYKWVFLWTDISIIILLTGFDYLIKNASRFKILQEFIKRGGGEII